jgi:hypothetical protein
MNKDCLGLPAFDDVGGARKVLSVEPISNTDLPEGEGVSLRSGPVSTLRMLRIICERTAGAIGERDRAPLTTRPFLLWWTAIIASGAFGSSGSENCKVSDGSSSTRHR